MAKGEEVRHVIVVKAKEVVKARSATMAHEGKARDVICVKEKEKI